MTTYEGIRLCQLIHSRHQLEQLVLLVRLSKLMQVTFLLARNEYNQGFNTAQAIVKYLIEPITNRNELNHAQLRKRQQLILEKDMKVLCVHNTNGLS